MKIEKLYFTLEEVRDAGGCRMGTLPTWPRTAICASPFGSAGYRSRSAASRRRPTASGSPCRTRTPVSAACWTSMPTTHSACFGRRARPIALPRRRRRLRQHPARTARRRGSPRRPTRPQRGARPIREGSRLHRPPAPPPRRRRCCVATGVIPKFRASPDYREVRIGDEVFQLGPIQAEVVRALHAAQLAGDYGGRAGRRSSPRPVPRA